MNILRDGGAMLRAYAAATIMISFISSCTPEKKSKFLGPDYPSDYLIAIHDSFEQFHQDFHHYPKVWYDIWTNCSDNEKQAGCSQLLRGPVNERTILKPTGPDAVVSRYTYVLVTSGRDHYRIEVRDSKGKALFYSDEKHIAVPIE
jgi:hypothetical protein